MSKKESVKTVLWLLFSLWLVITVVLSSQNGPETASFSRWTRVLMNLLHIPEAKAAAFHAFLRKSAHIVVFFVLGGLLYGALFVTLRNSKHVWLWAGISCSAFAILDEVKKIFIAGRHLQWDEAGLNVSAFGQVLYSLDLVSGYREAKRRLM